MVLAGCALLLAAGPAWAAAPAPRLPVVQSRDFVGTAAELAVGSRLRLENLQVTNTGESRTLVLERFEVFTKDAQITIHGSGGDKVVPAPANVYFRGEVDGKPGSHAFLAKLEDGRTQGVISEDSDIYLIGADEAAAKAVGGPLEMQRVDPVMLKASSSGAFQCGNAQLPAGLGSRAVLDLGGGGVAPQLPEKSAAVHTGRVAIETDFEFYQLFNNTTAATTYIGNLIGYASTIYTAELGTSLVVQSVSLWTTSADPWTLWPAPTTIGQPDVRADCGLYEFGHYWNKNHTGVSRTIAFFMSGKSYNAGVAWIGALCASASWFNFTDTADCPGIPTDVSWFGDYGFASSFAGNFDINHPAVVWDILEVAHEIGHNFGSPHSHCYNGLEGNASPIDQCQSGEVDTHGACYSGTPSLPGPAGAGSGTIMSYCHLVRQSLTDISLTFGTGFAYGVQPGREATHMNNYISSVVSSNPSCLTLVSVPTIFGDGFEGGAVPGLWSGKTP